MHLCRAYLLSSDERSDGVLARDHSSSSEAIGGDVFVLDDQIGDWSNCCERLEGEEES